MERLAHKLANKISAELSYPSEKEKVIAYGLIALLQTSTMTFFVIILGVLLGTVIQNLILTFAVALLRKYSGGAHSMSITSCTTIGILFCVIFGVLTKFISNLINSSLILIIITIATFAFAFIIAVKYSPNDSINKPIKSTEKRKRMKKMTIIVLLSYLLISTVLLFISRVSTTYISYLLCLVISIIWQMNSLTSVGHLYLEKLDRLIYGIITLKGGHTNEEN